MYAKNRSICDDIIELIKFSFLNFGIEYILRKSYLYNLIF